MRAASDEGRLIQSVPLGGTTRRAVASFAGRVRAPKEKDGAQCVEMEGRGIMKTSYLALAVALMLPGGAFAQQADTSTSSQEASSQGLGDIVVTAMKSARGDSAQKVPLSITALGGEMLREQQLNTVKDIGHAVPGVHLNEASFAGFANFWIRGKGLDGTVINIEPQVAVVVDGMVHEFLLGNIIDTYDIEAVEVLRGPQGVLQGRNATAGVVSFRTRRPKDHLEVEAHAVGASNSRFELSSLVAGPLVPDLLKAKISGYYSRTSGFFDDDNGGTFVPAPQNPDGTDESPRGKVVGAETWSVRPTIVITPSPDLTISLVGEYTKQTGEAGAGGRVASPELGYDVTVPTNLQTLFGYYPPTGKFDVNLGNHGSVDMKARRLVGEINWDIGAGVFTSITGYRKVSYSGSFDGDATPFLLFQFPEGNHTSSRQFSQEARFASDFSDFVSFVVGGYYSKLSINQEERRAQTLFIAGQNNSTAIVQRGYFEQDGSSKALFYNIDINPLKGLTLSHGGRYTKDKKKIDMIPRGTCATTAFTGCPSTYLPTQRLSFDEFTPRFSVEYEITPQTLVYASHTKGYRSGVFNGRATNLATLGPAAPETVKAIEAGFKTTFLDGKARINVAAFKEKYNDIQRTISINGIQTFANAGSAKIKGFEVESRFLPLEGFELTGNLAYVRPRFDEFAGFNSSLRFNRVSEWTGTVGATYKHELANASRIILNGKYYYQSSQFFDTLNEFRQPSINMFHANIRYETDRYSVTLFGKNITNEYFGDQGTRFVVGAGTPAQQRMYVMYGGEPREFGIELGFKL